MIASIVLFILFSISDSAVAAIGNGDTLDFTPLPNEFCNSESDRKQRELLDKYPKDQEIIKLYALYIGLCRLADDGKISEHAASILWAEQRDNLISKRKRSR